MSSDATSDEKPSVTVVRTVAAYEDVDPTELREPLHDVIDLEALDKLFAERHNGERRGDGRVVFTYDDYEITVHSEGRVNVELLADA